MIVIRGEKYVEPGPRDIRVWEFDLRRFVKPGDEIQYESEWKCDKAAEVQRRDPIIHTAKVVEVYPRFCFVQLKQVKEGVNRWDIRSVNGHPLSLGNGRRE